LRIWPRSLDSDVLAAQQEKEEQEPTNDSGGNVSNVTTTTTSNADDKNSAFEVITPVIDRLVVFKSGLEHEVAPAHFHRIALTAWMVGGIPKHIFLLQ
jgi:Rps23 Pro-64 3,4-dihydroxylase Tpa1-like proline 4-hydroxylase